MKLNVLNLSACGLLSVMLACSLFAALATAQIPTAPAAGLDPSKLPDVVGIHLGMPVEQALAVMKSLFPDSTYLQSVTAGKYMQTSDKPWLTSMTEMLRSGCTGCNEAIIVRFSIPPNPQHVVAIQRSLVFGLDKQPMLDPTIAGLRQKYGPEASKTVPNPVQTITWLYDEQGQHLPASTPNFDSGCAGVVAEPPAGGNSLNNPSPLDFVLATNPITPSVIATIMRHPCRSNVYVHVQLSPTGPGNSLVHIIDIQMSENALDTRDVIAAQQYLDGVATGQKQQELKHAQQQGAPKL
jgi:hypothetical protein